MCKLKSQETRLDRHKDYSEINMHLEVDKSSKRIIANITCSLHNIVLSVLYELTHPHNHLGGKEYFELQFIDEETKPQRTKENCSSEKETQMYRTDF